MMKELIEKLYEEDMLWFFLANLISADSLCNEQDCESALSIIDSLTKTLKDDDLAIDQTTKTKLDDLSKQLKEVVEKEYARFKLS